MTFPSVCNGWPHIIESSFYFFNYLWFWQLQTFIKGRVQIKHYDVFFLKRLQHKSHSPSEKDWTKHFNVINQSMKWNLTGCSSSCRSSNKSTICSLSSSQRQKHAAVHPHPHTLWMSKTTRAIDPFLSSQIWGSYQLCECVNVCIKVWFWDFESAGRRTDNTHQLGVSVVNDQMLICTTCDKHSRESVPLHRLPLCCFSDHADSPVGGFFKSLITNSLKKQSEWHCTTSANRQTNTGREAWKSR